MKPSLPTSAAADDTPLSQRLQVYVDVQKSMSAPYKLKLEYSVDFMQDLVEEIKKLEAQQTDDTLRQRIDKAHSEVYPVWNGAAGRLNASELNHLESALTILANIIDELNSPHSPGEGKAGKEDSGSNDRKVRTSPSLGPDALSELRTQIETLKIPHHLQRFKTKVEADRYFSKDRVLKLVDSAEARKK